MMDHVLQLVYLLAAVSFMVGLKMLSRPDSARRGNAIAAIGMTLAIFATIFLFRGQDGSHLGNLPYIFIALVVGSAIGYLMAKRVQMTAMPQIVSFFNGMGGACAAMISLIEYGHLSHAAESGDAALFQTKIPIILAGGSVRPGELAAGASLLDVPPTICHALGVPMPESYAGFPLAASLSDALQAA